MYWVCLILEKKILVRKHQHYTLKNSSNYLVHKLVLKILLSSSWTFYLFLFEDGLLVNQFLF